MDIESARSLIALAGVLIAFAMWRYTVEQGRLREFKEYQIARDERIRAEQQREDKAEDAPSLATRIAGLETTFREAGKRWSNAASATEAQIGRLSEQAVNVERRVIRVEEELRFRVEESEKTHQRIERDIRALEERERQ